MSISICVWNRDFAVIGADRGFVCVTDEGTLYNPHTRDVSKLHRSPNLPMVVAQTGSVYDDVVDSFLEQTMGTVRDVAASLWSAVYEKHHPIASSRLAAAGSVSDEQRRALSNTELLVVGMESDGSLCVAEAHYPEMYPCYRPQHGLLAAGNYSAIIGVADLGIDFSRIDRDHAVELCKLLVNTTIAAEGICASTGGLRGASGPADFLLLENGTVTPC